MPRQAIKAFAKAIQIPYLVHFTRAANIPSIMANGLYPIGRAEEIGANPHINDQYRLDGHRDSTSLSIGFPNSQMLYKYRMADPAVDWAILVLNPSILWEKDCAFCRHNAADGRISRQPLADLMTPKALVAMYEEIEGMLPRAEQNLKTYDPTDVQAEVLAFGVIEPPSISAVIFEKAVVRDAYIPNTGSAKTFVNPNNKGMFASRNYARTWGN